jgi:branched-subunit amino acid permease
MIRFNPTSVYSCTFAGALGAGLIAVAAGLVYIDWSSLTARRDIESDPASLVRAVIALILGAIGSALFAGACLAACLRLAIGLSDLGSGLRASALAREQPSLPANHSTNK